MMLIGFETKSSNSTAASFAEKPLAISRESRLTSGGTALPACSRAIASERRAGGDRHDNQRACHFRVPYPGSGARQYRCPCVHHHERQPHIRRAVAPARHSSDRLPAPVGKFTDLTRSHALAGFRHTDGNLAIGCFLLQQLARSACADLAGAAADLCVTKQPVEPGQRQ